LSTAMLKVTCHNYISIAKVSNSFSKAFTIQTPDGQLTQSAGLNTNW